MWEMRSSYNILIKEISGKNPLGRPRRRWGDNIRMDLREIGWEGIWLRVGISGGFL
jgi:hypothetical protein